MYVVGKTVSGIIKFYERYADCYVQQMAVARVINSPVSQSSSANTSMSTDILETSEAWKDVVADFEEMLRDHELSDSSSIDEQMQSNLPRSRTRVNGNTMTSSWPHATENTKETNPVSTNLMSRSWTSGYNGWTNGGSLRGPRDKYRPAVTRSSSLTSSDQDRPVPGKLPINVHYYRGAVPQKLSQSSKQTNNSQSPKSMPINKMPPASPQENWAMTENNLSLQKKFNVDVSAISHLYGNRVQGLKKLYGEMSKPVIPRKRSSSTSSAFLNQTKGDKIPPPPPPRKHSLPVSSSPAALKCTTTEPQINSDFCPDATSNPSPQFMNIFTPPHQKLVDVQRQTNSYKSDVFRPAKLESVSNTFPRMRLVQPAQSPSPEPPKCITKTDSQSSLASDTSFSSVASLPFAPINNSTPTVTSTQIAANMAQIDARHDAGHSQLGYPPVSSSSSSVTPKTLEAIREQMVLGLQRMRELEEQAKAIPVLQVKINVLKEEKRLLMLQLKAKEQALKLPKTILPVKPATWSVGVGNCHIGESVEDFVSKHVDSSAGDEGIILERQVAAVEQMKPEMKDTSFGDGDVNRYDPEEKNHTSALHLNMHHTITHSPVTTPTKHKACKNMGVQAEIHIKKPSRTVGLNFKPMTRDVGTVHTRSISNIRSIAVGSDSIEIEGCSECAERNNTDYVSVGVNHFPETETVACGGDFTLQPNQCTVCEDRFKDEFVSVGTNTMQHTRTVASGTCSVLPEPCHECEKRRNTARKLERVDGNVVSISPEQCKVCAERDSVEFTTSEMNTENTCYVDKQTNTEGQVNLFAEGQVVHIGEERKLAEVKPLMKRVDRCTSTEEGSVSHVCAKVGGEFASSQRGGTYSNIASSQQSDSSLNEVMDIDSPVTEKLGVRAIKEAGFTESGYLSSSVRSVSTTDIAVGETVILVDAAVGDDTAHSIDCDICLVKPKCRSAAVQAGMGGYLSTEGMYGTQLISKGVGEDTVEMLQCDKCAFLTTRTIAVGQCSVKDVFCDRCSFLKSRSLGVGECKTTDRICERCSELKTRTTGCGSCTVHDITCARCEGPQVEDRGTGDESVDKVVCNRCDSLTTRSVGAGANTIHDSFCSRCDNLTTTSVCVETDRICISDASVGEQTNVDTKGTGDGCVHEIFCDRCLGMSSASETTVSDDIKTVVRDASVGSGETGSRDASCNAAVPVTHAAVVATPEVSHKSCNTDAVNDSFVSTCNKCSDEINPLFSVTVPYASLQSSLTTSGTSLSESVTTSMSSDVTSNDSSPREKSSDSSDARMHDSAGETTSRAERRNMPYTDQQRQARIQYYTERLQRVQTDQEPYTEECSEETESYQNPMTRLQSSFEEISHTSPVKGKTSRFAHRIKPPTG